LIKIWNHIGVPLTRKGEFLSFIAAEVNYS